MKMMKRVLLLGVVLSSVWVWDSSPAFAGRGGQWAERHPARARENRALRRQRHEVRELAREGKITQEQKQADLQKIRDIHHQQVQDAQSNNNGGHLTGDQRKELNGEIKDMRKEIRGQGQTGSNPAPVTGSAPQ